MAKATEEKPAAEEQMVEKPREPMFSTMGMVIMLCAVLGATIATAVVVYTLFGSTSAEDEKPAEALSADAKFLELEGMSVPVTGVGNDKATVRFSILIEFEGGLAAAEKAIPFFREGNRDMWLKVKAQDKMQLYQISTIEDLGFNARYQNDLKQDLNAIPLKYPVANIYVAEKNVQRR